MLLAYPGRPGKDQKLPKVIIWIGELWQDGRQEREKTDGVEPPVGHTADIQTNCKYLDIPQSHGNHNEAVRKTATSKYYQRIR